mgnify:CR=1 FL=1
MRTPATSSVVAGPTVRVNLGELARKLAKARLEPPVRIAIAPNRLEIADFDVEARVGEREFRFTAGFALQAQFTLWSDVLAKILSNLAEVGNTVTIAVDGLRGRVSFYASSGKGFALYSLRAWGSLGFGKVRIYAFPLAGKARVLAGSRVEVAATRAGALKAA